MHVGFRKLLTYTQKYTHKKRISAWWPNIKLKNYRNLISFPFQWANELETSAFFVPKKKNIPSKKNPLFFKIKSISKHLEIIHCEKNDGSWSFKLYRFNALTFKCVLASIFSVHNRCRFQNGFTRGYKLFRFTATYLLCLTTFIANLCNFVASPFLLLSLFDIFLMLFYAFALEANILCIEKKIQEAVLINVTWKIQWILYFLILKMGAKHTYILVLHEIKRKHTYFFEPQQEHKHDMQDLRGLKFKFQAFYFIQNIHFVTLIIFLMRNSLRRKVHYYYYLATDKLHNPFNSTTKAAKKNSYTNIHRKKTPMISLSLSIWLYDCVFVHVTEYMENHQRSF